jgi:hypothetical protein
MLRFLHLVIETALKKDRLCATVRDNGVSSDRSRGKDGEYSSNSEYWTCTHNISLPPESRHVNTQWLHLQ